MTSRRSSGSMRADSAVEPTRSENITVTWRRSARSSGCALKVCGFNRSAQHLLILRGEEVCDGDVADLVHGSAESRAVGAMEEWAKCCGDLAGAGKEEQDGR